MIDYKIGMYHIKEIYNNHIYTNHICTYSKCFKNPSECIYMIECFVCNKIKYIKKCTIQCGTYYNHIIEMCINCITNLKIINHPYLIAKILNCKHPSNYHKNNFKDDYKILRILFLISNRKGEQIRKYISKGIFTKHIIPNILSIMYENLYIFQ